MKTNYFKENESPFLKSGDKINTKKNNFIIRPASEYVISRKVLSSRLPSNHLKKTVTKIHIQEKHINDFPPVIDKEQICDDNISLKNQINKLNSEISYLKSQLVKKDIDILKKENLLKEANNEDEHHFETKNSNSKIKESILIFNLKRKITSLENEFKEKKEENDNLKKNLKVSRVFELTEELKIFKEESIKLRELYEQQLSKNSDFTIVKEQLKNSKEQILNLHKSLKGFKNEILKIENENRLQHEEISKFKECIKNKDILVLNLKNKIKILSRDVNLDEKLKIFQTQIDENLKQIENLKNDNKIKEKKIIQLESDINQLKNEDCDVLSNAELKEISYMIIKIIQAHEIKPLDLENVLSSGNLEEISKNVSKLLMLNNDLDKKKVKSYFKTHLKTTSLYELKIKLLTQISLIEPYTQQVEEKMKMKISSVLGEYKQNLEILFNNFDQLNEKKLKLSKFRSILSNLVIDLDDDEIEFIICLMKKDPNLMLDELRYSNLLDVIENIPQNNTISKYRNNLVIEEQDFEESNVAETDGKTTSKNFDKRIESLLREIKKSLKGESLENKFKFDTKNDYKLETFLEILKNLKVSYDNNDIDLFSQRYVGITNNITGIFDWKKFNDDYLNSIQKPSPSKSPKSQFNNTETPKLRDASLGTSDKNFNLIIQSDFSLNPKIANKSKDVNDDPVSFHDNEQFPEYLNDEEKENKGNEIQSEIPKTVQKEFLTSIFKTATEKFEVAQQKNNEILKTEFQAKEQLTLSQKFMNSIYDAMIKKIIQREKE